MKDRRAWTRAVLRMAADSGEPDLGRMRAALPEILARARRDRASVLEETTLEALVPVGRRLLPALAAAAASLALAALLFDPAPTADPWEVSLLTQAADEAQTAEAVTEAVAGEYAP